MEIGESTRAIFDELNESVYFLDSEGKIVFANRMFVKRLEKERSQVEGESIYDVLPPDVVEQRRQCIEKVAVTAKPVTYEEDRSGEVFLNSVSPILDENGRVENIAFVGTNITEQRRLLESLTSVIERLEEFTQVISHDIKGPLSTAFAAAKTLQAMTTSPSSQASVELLDEDEVVDMLMKSRRSWLGECR